MAWGSNKTRDGGVTAATTTTQTPPPPSEASNLLLVNPETISAGAKAGAAAINVTAQKLKTGRAEGPLSYRILAFLGGLAMIASNALAILDRFFSFNFTGSLLAVYGTLFGVIVTALEGSWSCPTRLQSGIRYYAKFLEYTWGRGVLYFFVGSLQASNFNMLDWAVGGFMMFVGVTAVAVGLTTSAKLKQLRRSIVSEHDLRIKWDNADINKNGTLDIKELAILARDSDVDLSRNEVAAAFLAIDRNFDEKLTFEEFYAWWCEAGSLSASRALSV